MTSSMARVKALSYVLTIIIPNLGSSPGCLSSAWRPLAHFLGPLEAIEHYRAFFFRHPVCIAMTNLHIIFMFILSQMSKSC